MGWIHDTGFEPAYDHEGWTATVLDDGSDASGWPLPAGREVTGWRPACECGWRGAVWSRAEWPSDDGQAPSAIEDGKNGTDGQGCYGQWQAHLREALPDLAVYDANLRFEEARAELDTAVIDARATGIAWDRIGTAVGTSRQAAREQWDALVRAATEPVRLDGEPADGPLDSFGTDVTRRCLIARRLYGGHPNRAWSTSERLAVALALRDPGHLQEMDYTIREAQQRVAGGMSRPPRDIGAWLDRIRFDLNTHWAKPSRALPAGELQDGDNHPPTAAEGSERNYQRACQDIGEQQARPPGYEPQREGEAGQ